MVFQLQMKLHTKELVPKTISTNVPAYKLYIIQNVDSNSKRNTQFWHYTFENYGNFVEVA
jgi:hypothetical protein